MTLLPRLLSHRAAFYALRLLCSASENLSDQFLLRLIIDQQVPSFFVCRLIGNIKNFVMA